MRVVFRVDASLEIGTGHVMRCLTLADALHSVNGAECQFICREHTGHLIDYIRGKGYYVNLLPAINSVSRYPDSPVHANFLGCSQQTDVDQCADLFKEINPEWMVVDHYALDSRWEIGLSHCYQRLLVIDDLADRPHNCDLLLDQTLGRTEDNYALRVDKVCKLLCGARYVLLRPEFSEMRDLCVERRRKRARLQNILITMGGVDNDNATGDVLEALGGVVLPGDCVITVVIGANAPWREDVQALANAMPWVTNIREGVSNMAELMADSDLAIGAGGITAWERCSLGLPTLAMSVAENQQPGLKALEAVGAVLLLNPNYGLADQLADYLELMQQGDLRQNMAAASFGIVDGFGVQRVLKELCR